MDRAEFDKFADEYYALHAANIAMTGESPEYFADYKPSSCINSVVWWPKRASIKGVNEF